MKKIHYIYNIMILALISATIVGCKKFEDMNQDPNEPTEVPTSYLLASAQKVLMDNIMDEWTWGRIGSLHAQYWAQNEYTNESRYNIRENVNNNNWIYWYAGENTTAGPSGGGITDLEQIIRLNTENNIGAVSENQIAVARIMKVWVYQIMTDHWGPIPYTQALNPDEFPLPTYDTQETIYMDLLNELTEASAQIDVDADGFTSGDLIYGGDMVKWKKFANSLKLRVAMRVADVKSADASSAVTEAVAAGVFESNDDNALLSYTALPNNHPMNNNLTVDNRKDFAVSDVLINQLTALNDPRIDYYANEKVNGGGYVGMEYGLSDALASNIPNNNVSQPSDEVYAADFPGIFMDYAEVEFALAEAAARGYIGGNAADHYANGVRASMHFWGISDDAAINTYLAQPSVQYNAGNFRQSIGLQKWLALYMHDFQGWYEYSRLDFTGVLKAPAVNTAELATTVPTRMTYPVDEQSLNAANYTKGLELLGTDAMDTKLWWDVNPNEFE